PATTRLPSLSLHDALPISAALDQLPRVLPERGRDLPGEVHRTPGRIDEGVEDRQLGRLVLARQRVPVQSGGLGPGHQVATGREQDRKSTRLNSSHVKNSYA